MKTDSALNPATLLANPELSLPARPGAACPIHRLPLSWQRWLAPLRPGRRQDSPLAATAKEAAAPIARCPLGHAAPRSGTVFIGHAQAEAATALILPGDPAADELLRTARAAIYHWPPDFPGFSARLEFSDGATTWEASLWVKNSRTYRLELPECPHEKWVRYQLEEMFSHREAPEMSRIASRSGVLLGDEHLLYGRQVIFAGDKMGSYYRLKDRKITQIRRAYGKLDFIIHIDGHAEFQGRFAAQDYTVFYRDRATGLLSKVETFRDTYQEIAGQLLPQERLVSEAHAQKITTRRLLLHQIALLSPPTTLPE